MKNRISLLLLMLLAVCTAQAVTVSGTIVDETDFPLPGTSVVVTGTTQGTVTDMDGNFSLNVDDAATKTITISSIGFETQVISLADKTEGIQVKLKDENISLNEVVAVGYGTVKKKDITGSVATVSADQLVAVPVASATEALQGKMAGVQITTTEGSPDADINIRVRGGGSITGDNTPLLIVDGFPVETIADIPSSDIEDISVLKDASSTAIYGSRGANGVILVTTKGGSEGKVAVSYNCYYSWKKIEKTLDVLDPYDYAKWQYELAMLAKGEDDTYVKYFGNYEDMDLYQGVKGNDWQDLTFGRVGHTWNQNFSITGGADKVKYTASYNHMDDKAIMEESKFQRHNAQLKLQMKPFKPIGIDGSVRFAKTKIYGGGANETTSTLDSDKRLKYSLLYTPIPLKDLGSESGDDDDDSSLGNLYNPIEAIYDNDRVKDRMTLNLAGALTIEIIKNLKLKGEFGYDRYTQEDKRFWGTTTYYAQQNVMEGTTGQPAIRIVNTTRNTVRSTNTLSYDFKKVLNQNNHLNLLIGEEWICKREQEMTSEVHGFPLNFTSNDAWNLSTQGTPYNVDNYYSPDDKLFSLFGRANYDYKDKYLVSFTYRADQSSKFTSGNQWGYFPSGAIAWRISGEGFMEGTTHILSDLKLRVSMGTAGNNNIPTGQTKQEYEGAKTTYVNNVSTVLNPSKTMANPDLKWETTITRNIGLDYTFLNGKVNGNFELYWNTTKDLLIEFPVAGTGYDTQYRNMGKTENKGFEAQINWTIIEREKWGISLNANVGINRNKIKSLGIMEDFGAETRWASSDIGNDFWVAKGGRVGQLYGYQSDGRYEVSDFTGYDGKSWILKEGVADCSSIVGSSSSLRPGMMKLKDTNGDGEITPDDRSIIGDTNPKATGGFAINANFFGFDFAANFTWSAGNDVYNANKLEGTLSWKYQYRNMLDIMEDGKRWTNLMADGSICNDPATLESMNKNTSMWSPFTAESGKMVFTDWAVEKGSFFRLSTLTLGYTINKELTQRWHIQTFRIYVTGQNLFCATGYSGYDPEVSTIRKTNLTPGVDYSAYPKSRSFVVGLNLNF